MRPVVRSEDTQKNGLASSSIRRSPKLARSMVLASAASNQCDQGQCEIVERIVGDENLAHAIGEFFDAPFLGHARGNDRADGGARMIERHLGFHQRLDDADMRKAPRAAAPPAPDPQLGPQ